MGPESTFIKGVHRYIPEGVYWMKNHNQYNGGIPDVWYSGDRADLWIEYKFIAVPKRPETRIDLLTGKNPAISYLQQEWLRSRHGEGRSVGVIVGSKDGGIWLPGVAWEQPFTAKDFLAHLRTRKDLADTIQKEVQRHG